MQPYMPVIIRLFVAACNVGWIFIAAVGISSVVYTACVEETVNVGMEKTSVPIDCQCVSPSGCQISTTCSSYGMCPAITDTSLF